MRRLVDRTLPPASLEAGAAELFRAADTSDASGPKQRVRERLLETRVVRARPRFVLAPAIVLVGLAIATAAGATLGVRWWRGARVAPPSVAAPVANRPSSPVAPVAAVAPARVPEVAPPTPTPERPAAAHARRARTAGEDGETRLLFDATRALRRDRDPQRAGALLDDYFRRYPRGALAEEALAVAIEAATARGDARARTLARRYLARYPSGQFRALPPSARWADPRSERRRPRAARRAGRSRWRCGDGARLRRGCRSGSDPIPTSCGGRTSSRAASTPGTPPGRRAVVSCRRWQRPSRSGRCAVQSQVVPQPAGTISGAMLIDPGPIPSDAYESAWFFVPEAIASVGYWVFFKLGSRTVPDDPATGVDVWDFNLQPTAAGGLEVAIIPRATGTAPPQLLADASVPIGRWFQIEAHLRASPDADGVLELWRDDTLLYQVRGPTAPSAAVSWSVGGGCEQLTSPAAVVDIDDAAVARRRLGPNFPIFTR